MSGLGCYSLGFLMTLLAQIFHRGSLGFGEEALQSLPGRIGCQVLALLVVHAFETVYEDILYPVAIMNF